MSDAEELQQFREQALLQLMSDISEGCWCAGWISGNENALYRMAFDEGPRRYGMSEVGDAEVNRLRDLAEKSGKWARWDDVEGVVPIDLFGFRRAFLASKEQSGG